MVQTLKQLKSGELKGAVHIKLNENLTEFPREVLDLEDTLEVLDLTGNNLSHLPDDFARLKKLKIFFCSNNHFTTFPVVLSQCPQLDIIGFKANKIANLPENSLPLQIRWLILTDNAIPELPNSIGKCLNLQKLMLAGNKIKQLPAAMAACRQLELLRISANCLTGLPDWLFTLPRLSWLAFAGNLINLGPPLKNNLPLINWENLIILETLGEGASGIIVKALWKEKPNIPAKEVAVKLFKGEVTSDGSPTDEMAACLAAGKHNHIVPVLGKVVGHPDQKQGLVLNLLPPVYRILGNPPSLETCTRDTFPANTCFSLYAIITIAIGVASAIKHLHQQGIMHGDIYAHNILVNQQAFPLLSDFGAATIYRTTKPETAILLEKIEVRAFGCLLEDLLNYIVPDGKLTQRFKLLKNLQQDCQSETITLRPNFTIIQERLKEIIKIMD